MLNTFFLKKKKKGGGVHGNAILSKHDIDFRVIEHRKDAYNWNKNGTWLKEPRDGK